MTSGQVDAAAVLLRSTVRRKWVAVLWLVAIELVLVAVVIWFAATWSDPNYRWIFVPDGLMRVRNALFITLGLVWMPITAHLYGIATGRVPLAEFRVIGAQQISVTAKRGLFAGLRDREWILTRPVHVRWAETPSAGAGGSFARILTLRTSSKSVRIGTMWAWNDDDREALLALLENGLD